MIVASIIALLAAIAIPSFMKSRADSRAAACVNNLRLIDHAKQQGGMANNWASDKAIGWADISIYISGCPTKGLVCPEVGTGAYAIGYLTNIPTCSFTGPGHVLVTHAITPP